MSCGLGAASSDLDEALNDRVRIVQIGCRTHGGALRTLKGPVMMACRHRDQAFVLLLCGKPDFLWLSRLLVTDRLDSAAASRAAPYRYSAALAPNRYRRWAPP